MRSKVVRGLRKDHFVNLILDRIEESENLRFHILFQVFCYKLYFVFSHRCSGSMPLPPEGETFFSPRVSVELDLKPLVSGGHFFLSSLEW